MTLLLISSAGPRAEAPACHLIVRDAGVWNTEQGRKEEGGMEGWKKGGGLILFWLMGFAAPRIVLPHSRPSLWNALQPYTSCPFTADMARTHVRAIRAAGTLSLFSREVWNNHIVELCELKQAWVATKHKAVFPEEFDRGAECVAEHCRV